MPTTLNEINVKYLTLKVDLQYDIVNIYALPSFESGIRNNCDHFGIELLNKALTKL